MHQINESICGLKVADLICIISFHFIFRRNIHLTYANSIDPDPTPHSAASDLVVRCLLMSNL